MIGRTLGHYRIDARLGAGGMGVVYRAWDLQLERAVALKVPGESLQADSAARARLIEEARAASALNHQGICTIYEVGEAGDLAYIVMEYVEGRSLSALIPPDGLPVESLLRYGTQIADALAHAHERGVVHRDLKSANIIITPEGRAKVLDFGLAKRLKETEAAELTRSMGTPSEAGAIVGTIAYMPPEVLRGSKADSRSDIWALGVVLYEAAAGSLPFQGATSFDVSSAILRDSPRPPSHAPAALQAVIQRCLAKEPGERYQRAGEIRAVLETMQPAAAPLPAAPPRQIPRRRWWIGIAIAAVLILVVGLVGEITRRWTQRPAAPSGPQFGAGERPSPNREANEYLQRGLLFLLTRQDVARTREMLEKALALDPRFAAARCWYALTHFLMVEDGYSNDTNWLYKAEEDLRRALQDDPAAPAHRFLAAVYLFQGRKELVLREVEMALQAIPGDQDALLPLGQYHRLNGDYDEALRVGRQMLERDPLFWPARTYLGDVLRLRGDTAGAIQEQKKVLEQSPENIHAHHFLSLAYTGAGDLVNARHTLERVQPQDRQSYLIRTAWALLLVLEGKRDEALKTMDEEVLKSGAANIFLTLHVAEFYAALGDVPKALEWFDRDVRNGDDGADWFRRDPLLANIRDHPRFKQILESVDYRRQQRLKSSAGR